MNMRFSEDVKNYLLRKESLQQLPNPEGAKPISENNRLWGNFLGHVTLKTIVFTNFKGNSEQAENIVHGLSSALPHPLAYGFSSIPDNRTPGWSDSVVAMRSKLGTNLKLKGQNMENPKGHQDTGVVRESNQNFELSIYGNLGHAAENVIEKMGDLVLSEKMKRIHRIGNFVLLHDHDVADLTGLREEDVTGGSAFLLTGYNSNYGTTAWAQVASGVQAGEDKNPLDLDR